MLSLARFDAPRLPRTPKRTARRVAAAATVALALTTLVACSPNDSGHVTSLEELPAEAREIIDRPEYQHANWSVSVQDLDTSESVIDINGDRMAEPASFTKSYTMGAAWLRWGPDHVITTPVKATGATLGGVLDGDLVLVGMGDITLGGRTQPDGSVDFTNFDHNDANALPGATLTDEDPLAGLDQLAAQVKAAGIDEVAGDVVVDDRLFQGSLEGQPISPIIVNQNLIDVLVTPGEVGQPAKVEMRPQVAPWRVVSNVETVAPGAEAGVSNPELSADGEITIEGTIAADSDPVLKVHAFEDPATFARTAFIEALGRAGVVTHTAPTAPNTTEALGDLESVMGLPSVAEFESLPLDQQATYVLKVSYNRGAHTYVCLQAVEAGSDECEAGLPEMGRVLSDAGLDTTAMSLVDGSGLAGNLITAENGTQLQQIMWSRPDADRWLSTLPILGIDGSLTDVQQESPAAGKVFAKTGTLVGGDQLNERFRIVTKALGGVIQSESGRNLAFTIILNNGFTPEIDGVFQANDDVGAVAASIQQAF